MGAACSLHEKLLPVALRADEAIVFLVRCCREPPRRVRGACAAGCSCQPRRNGADLPPRAHDPLAPVRQLCLRQVEARRVAFCCIDGLVDLSHLLDSDKTGQ